MIALQFELVVDHSIRVEEMLNVQREVPTVVLLVSFRPHSSGFDSTSHDRGHVSSSTCAHLFNIDVVIAQLVGRQGEEQFMNAWCTCTREYVMYVPLFTVFGNGLVTGTRGRGQGTGEGEFVKVCVLCIG